MKKIASIMTLFLSTSLFAAEQSIICSDAKQDLNYFYQKESYHPQAAIDLRIHSKILYKKLPTENTPEVNDADYTFLPDSYVKIDQKTEDKQDEVGPKYSQITTIYAQRLSIKDREKGDSIFDSFVLCESIQKIR